MRKITTFYPTVELLEKVKKEAENQKRPVSNVICVILENYFEE